MKKESGCKGITVCLVVTLCIVMAILLLGVILALTVFKPHHPITTVDSIRLRNMTLGMDIFSMRVNVNVTLDVDVSVNNPNKIGFRNYNSSAELYYRGGLIGEAPIPDGDILAKEIKDLNLTVTLMADRLVSHSELTNDVASGSLPLNSSLSIFGQVKLLGFVIFDVASTSTCDFALDIYDKEVVDKKCHAKTRISG